VLYEVAYRLGSTVREIAVTADGKLVEEEGDDAEEEDYDEETDEEELEDEEERDGAR
jgi:hypothetical protein